MSHTICLLPGDGIGPEVSQAAREVIDASGAAIDWIELPAGAGAVADHGDVLPQHTLDTLAQVRLALKGPLTTPIGGGLPRSTSACASIFTSTPLSARSARCRASGRATTTLISS
jgi:isocitrate/isopropylmalate dehydrogenase